MSVVLYHFSRFIELSDEQYKRNDTHICKLSNSSALLSSDLTSLWVGNLILGIKLPHEEECISNVLIGGTRVPVDNTMADFSDLVDEEHHTLLEDFGSVCEVTDVTEAED